MAKRERAYLGIDFQADRMRVVEVRVRGNRPYINFAVSSLMPAGAYEAGLIRQPAVVASVLRSLLDSSGAERNARAVIGVPLERTSFRNVNLPPAPDHEFASMVAGEVEHFGMLQSGRGAHGFFKHKPPVKTAAGDPISVSLVAVDDDVTGALRVVADRADIEVEALEPTTLAMYRAAMIEAGSVPTVCSLVLSGSGSEITFAFEGQLVTYRRIETGSNALLGAQQNSGIRGVPQAFASAFQTSTVSDSDAEGAGISDTAVGMLALEVRRTLEYLEREYPSVVIAEKLLVVVDVPGLETLDKVLQEKLGIPVELVRPRMTSLGVGASAGSSSESPQADAALSGPEAYTFAAAYGLAMQQAAVGVRVPKLDLFSNERSAAVTQESSRNFLGSIVVSVAAVALALVGNFLYKKQIGLVETATEILRGQAAQVSAQINQTVVERQLHAKQYKLLRREGVPVGVIMDYLVGSIAPGVGLTSITVSPDLKVSISGEALDEKPMLATVQDLQKSPILSNLVISSFNRVPNKGISFTLDARTVAMDRVRLPDEKSDAPRSGLP